MAWAGRWVVHGSMERHRGSLVKSFYRSTSNLYAGGMARQQDTAAPGRVTIYEVAAEAGVSISTVSLALNSPARVSDRTREKVLGAADALGFVPKTEAVTRARKALGRRALKGVFGGCRGTGGGRGRFRPGARGHHPLAAPGHGAADPPPRRAGRHGPAPGGLDGPATGLLPATDGAAGRARRPLRLGPHRRPRRRPAGRRAPGRPGAPALRLPRRGAALAPVRLALPAAARRVPLGAGGAGPRPDRGCDAAHRARERQRPRAGARPAGGARAAGRGVRPQRRPSRGSPAGGPRPGPAGARGGGRRRLRRRRPRRGPGPDHG